MWGRQKYLLIQMLSPLHTDGRWIKDRSGRTVRLTGCEYPQSMFHNPVTYQYWKHEADPIPFAERMLELGVNFVRISTTYSLWITTDVDANGKTYKDWIDDYVLELNKRGIYCSVGCHGWEFQSDVPNNNPSNWLAFLQELALRYIDVPGMCGIYIWNEPPDAAFTTDQLWRDWAVMGVQAINAVNPKLLNFVHSKKGYPRDTDPYWVSNPIQFPNVVYVYHYYFWQSYYYDHLDYAENYALGNYELAKQQMELDQYEKHWKYAVEYNLCVMNEEYGFNDDQVLQPYEKYWNPGWPQCQIDYTELMNKYSIPWCQYCWWVYTGVNYGMANEIDYYTLSPVGEIWEQFLGTPIQYQAIDLIVPTLAGLSMIYVLFRR